MASDDASAIYERFVATPLKIKPKRAPPAAAAAPVDEVQGKPAAPQATSDRGDAKADGADVPPKGHNDGGVTTIAAPSLVPSQVSPTRKELKQMNLSMTAKGSASSSGATGTGNQDGEVQPVDGTGAGSGAPRERSMETPRKRKTQKASSYHAVPSSGKKAISTADIIIDEIVPSTPSPRKDSKKQKRVSRLTLLENPSTGGFTLDTPTKSAQPAKRSKKSGERKSGSAAAKEESREADDKPKGEPEKENRSLLADFVNCIGKKDEEKEPVTPQKIVISPAKRRSTRFRRLTGTPPSRQSRRIQASQPDATVPADYLTVVCDQLLGTNTISGALFAVVLNSLRHIQEEFLQQNSSSDQSPVDPFQTVNKICLGIANCEALAQSQDKDVASHSLQNGQRRGSKPSLMKKSVRFQSFDLSCLSLQYVRNRHTEKLVDNILRHYDMMMSHTLQMLRDLKQNSASGNVEAQILRELVDVLNDKSMLYRNPDTLSEEAERIYLAAFGSRDPHAQHEIQLCRAYFATEVRKLVVDPHKSAPSPTRFLERIFSPLVSSSMRYKLRALFLEHNAEVSEAKSAIPAMATYTHQDFGSSVHCALQESLLYRPLAIPIIRLLERKRPRDEVTKYLDTVKVEDLEHVHQFVLARRFLRYHIKKSHESPSADGFTAPKDFVANLEKQETLLSQLESSLKDFYQKQQAIHAWNVGSWSRSWRRQVTLFAQRAPATFTLTACICRRLSPNSQAITRVRRAFLAEKEQTLI
ncbi:hypothetical protein FI667_g2329, partial [Globisporangium splendens]